MSFKISNLTEDEINIKIADSKESSASDLADDITIGSIEGKLQVKDAGIQDIKIVDLQASKLTGDILNNVDNFLVENHGLRINTKQYHRIPSSYFVFHLTHLYSGKLNSDVPNQLKIV